MAIEKGIFEELASYPLINYNIQIVIIQESFKGSKLVIH